MAIVIGQRAFGAYKRNALGHPRMMKVKVYTGRRTERSKSRSPEPFAAPISPSRRTKRPYDDTEDGRIPLQAIDANRPTKKPRSMLSTWAGTNKNQSNDDDDDDEEEDSTNNEEDFMDTLEQAFEKGAYEIHAPQRKIAVPKSRKQAPANNPQASQSSIQSNKPRRGKPSQNQELPKTYEHTKNRKKWNVALPSWNGGPKGENSWMQKKDTTMLKAELQKRGISHLFNDPKPPKRAMVHALMKWDNDKTVNGLKAEIHARGRGLANLIDPSWGTDEVHELIALLDEDDRHTDENGVPYDYQLADFDWEGVEAGYGAMSYKEIVAVVSKKWRFLSEGPGRTPKRDLILRATQDEWAEFISEGEPCRAFFYPGCSHSTVDCTKKGPECEQCDSLRKFLNIYDLMAIFPTVGTLRADGAWEGMSYLESEDRDDEAEEDSQSEDTGDESDEEEL
ncbi:hypothetical protein BU16DRAFT_534570 [Lophium mytilinum]|uniref:Uncharacterized protein n=1 Tax=Lophium mytilinum TaxID=390894 RepID=A0A6A6R566_9PEZI|nr:hypothetical protein BU16DRAFT_534570 [Lophium mytilinum]